MPPHMPATTLQSNSPTSESSMTIRTWPSANADLDKDSISIPSTPPNGTRTPNGLPWGHSPDQFFKIVLPSSEPDTDSENASDATVWSRSMIKEAWGEDVFAKGRSAGEDEAADEYVRELTPRVKRPWPVLGRRASRRTKCDMHPGKEWWKVFFGRLDEGSDHEDDCELRFDDNPGEFQKDGKEMLREIQDVVALLHIDKGQKQSPASCTSSERVAGTVPNEDNGHVETQKDQVPNAVTGDCDGKTKLEDSTPDTTSVDPTHHVGQNGSQDASPIIVDSTPDTTSADPTHQVGHNEVTYSPQDASHIVDEQNEAENAVSSANEAPSSNTINSADTKEGVDNATTASSGDSHSRLGSSDGGSGGGLTDNTAVEHQEVVSVGLESLDVNMEDAVVNENGGPAKSLVRDEKATEDVNDGMQVIASDPVHFRTNITSNGLCENSVLSEIPVRNPPNVENPVDGPSSDVTRVASKGPIAEDTDVTVDDGGVIDGCAAHIDSDVKGDVGVGIGIMNGDISNEQLANQPEGLRNDNPDGVTTVDLEPSDNNLPHDAMSTNTGKLPNSGHVRENDAKEKNGHPIVPSQAPPRQENISVLSEAAIRAHTVTTAYGSTRFEIEEGPKLEEWIPEEYLPEVLVVYDPDGVSSFRSKPPMKIYRRKYPVPASTRESKEGDDVQCDTNGICEHLKPEMTPTGQLFLYRSERIGEGNHSYVYRASLRLPTPLYARDSPHNVVSVAAKLANRWHEKESLDNEAALYAGFDKHLAEEWCGFNKVGGVTRPVRVGAVVPKFYGYYLPEGDDNDKESWDDPADVMNNMMRVGSPILLLEECGTPVRPNLLTHDQRVEMYSLFCRLHNANICQRSASLRNMVMQPGPLTLPPHQRSMEHPSFRVIDFGSGKATNDEYYSEREKKQARGELSLWRGRTF